MTFVGAPHHWVGISWDGILPGMMPVDVDERVLLLTYRDRHLEIRE